MRIAFFDSGIGGLTVLRQALDVMPHEEYLYYADTAHVPYGVKPKEEVRRHVADAVAFLARQNIQALVVACNTATAVAISELRSRYDFPIIGMEPAVKPALARNAGKKVLVFATSLTLKESKLETLLNTLDTTRKVERRELDGLVAFAEAFEFDTPLVQAYLQAKLAHTPWDQYETIVLGCTHFLFYREQIRAWVGDAIQMIDGNEGTVRHLRDTLGLSPATGTAQDARIDFYSSGVRETPARVKRLSAVLFSAWPFPR